MDSSRLKTGGHNFNLSTLPENPDSNMPVILGITITNSRTRASSGTATPTCGQSSRQSVVTFAEDSQFSTPYGSRSNLFRLGQDASRDSSRRPSMEITTSSSASSVFTEDRKLNESAEPPYNVFSKRRQKAMLYLASIAGIFSSLSSNIYFPALGIISEDLNVSLSTMSFTVTIYMIAQGVAPSFWGPLSDTKGRRISYIGTFIVYIGANLGLALSQDFPGLMVLRGIQAAGSAATIAIGSGVISDIATPRERGAFTGINSGIRMSGQSLGPVLGGIIAQYLGYHAIFWFLFIFAALVLIFVVLFFPETLRSVAGNGSIKLTGINRPLIYNYKEPHPSEILHDLPPKKKVTWSSIFFPFRALLEKDVSIVLIVTAVNYTIWSMVTSSTTALFEEPYNLDLLQLGLIFIPNGVGSTLGSIMTGRSSKRAWDDAERAYRKAKNIPDDIPLKKKELNDFPFEQARMGDMWWMACMLLVSTALYGFSFRLNDDLAVPLILQFLIAYSQASIFNVTQTLMVDLYPEASASASAITNLARCLIGAAGVAAIQPMIDSLGAGVAYGILAGIGAVVNPLLLVEWYKGAEWRMARSERIAKAKKAKLGVDEEKMGGVTGEVEIKTEKH